MPPRSRPLPVFLLDMMVSPDPLGSRVVALLRLNTHTVSEVVRAVIIEQFLQTVVGLWWLNGRSDVEDPSLADSYAGNDSTCIHIGIWYPQSRSLLRCQCSFHMTRF